MSPEDMREQAKWHEFSASRQNSPRNKRYHTQAAKIIRWAADVLEAEPAGVIGAAYGDPESFAQREVTLDDKVIQKSAFRSKLIVKPTFGDEP